MSTWYWNTYITKEAREILLGMHFGDVEFGKNIDIEGQHDYSRVSHITNHFLSVRSKPVSYRMR